MANLFSGLEAFGLGDLKKLNVYEEDNAGKKGADGKPAEKPQISEADLLFDKSYTCPVCDKEFHSKTVRTGKVKLLTADSDLRPKYQLVDSLKYDAIVCPNCGYAALSRFFNFMMPAQAKMIIENISTNYKEIKIEGDIYTYDEAIARHQLALANTIVKKGKTSEKAYTCLKLAWLHRGKAETLPEDTENRETVLKDLKEKELEFLENAYTGFLSAFSKESFPMCGMDEMTLTYLCGDLARRIKKYDEAGRWISKVLISREASERIKNKARDIKEEMQKEMGKNAKA